jgi:hypothetical protein
MPRLLKIPSMRPVRRAADACSGPGSRPEFVCTGGHDACAAHFVQRSPMPISLHSRSDRVIYQVINQKAYTEFAGMQT